MHMIRRFVHLCSAVSYETKVLGEMVAFAIAPSISLQKYGLPIPLEIFHLPIESIIPDGRMRTKKTETPTVASCLRVSGSIDHSSALYNCND
jgi:hypothetical protein